MEPALREARSLTSVTSLNVWATLRSIPIRAPEKQVWNRTITLKDTWAKEAKKSLSARPCHRELAKGVSQSRTFREAYRLRDTRNPHARG